MPRERASPPLPAPGGAGIPLVVVARRGDRLAALAERYDGVEVLAADLTTADGVASVEERIASLEGTRRDLEDKIQGARARLENLLQRIPE